MQQEVEQEVEQASDNDALPLRPGLSARLRATAKAASESSSLSVIAARRLPDVLHGATSKQRDESQASTALSTSSADESTLPPPSPPQPEVQ